MCSRTQVLIRGRHAAPRHRPGIVLLDRPDGHAAGRLALAGHVHHVDELLAANGDTGNQIRAKVRFGIQRIHTEKLHALIIFVHVEGPVTRAATGFASAFGAIARVLVPFVRIRNDLVLVLRAARAFVNAFVSMAHATTPAFR